METHQIESGADGITALMEKCHAKGITSSTAWTQHGKGFSWSVCIPDAVLQTVLGVWGYSWVEKGGGTMTWYGDPSALCPGYSFIMEVSLAGGASKRTAAQSAMSFMDGSDSDSDSDNDSKVVINDDAAMHVLSVDLKEHEGPIKGEVCCRVEPYVPLLQRPLTNPIATMEQAVALLNKKCDTSRWRDLIPTMEAGIPAAIAIPHALFPDITLVGAVALSKHSYTRIVYTATCGVWHDFLLTSIDVPEGMMQWVSDRVGLEVFSSEWGIPKEDWECVRGCTPCKVCRLRVCTEEEGAEHRCVVCSSQKTSLLFKRAALESAGVKHWVSKHHGGAAPRA